MILIKSQKQMKRRNIKKKIKDEESKEEIYFESNSDSSSEKEKEIQENIQNVEHESEKKRLDILKIENSENSDEYNLTEERPPPEPPPDQPSTPGLPRTQKNIIDCCVQLTTRKSNYAYLVTDNGELCDVGSKLLKKCGKLQNFKNLQKGIVQNLRKRNQYHFALPIEDEFKENLGETT